MPYATPIAQWNRLSKFFHWTIALAIIATLLLGFIADAAESIPHKAALFAWHKSFGLLVLVLSTLRLAWRLYIRAPEPLSHYKAYEIKLAQLTHILLYVLMFALPLSGWILNSAAGYKVAVFGLFPLPDLVSQAEELRYIAATVHEVMVWVLVGLLTLHLAGALKHHLIDQDVTLKRMLPRIDYAAIFIVMLLALGASIALATQYFVQPSGPSDPNSTGGTRESREATPSPAQPGNSGPAVRSEISYVGGEPEAATNEVAAHRSGAASTVWQALPASQLRFTYLYSGAEVNGEFPSFRPTIRFDKTQLENSLIDVAIDTGDIDAGNSDYSSAAKGAAWFASQQFPQARFRSISIRPAEQAHQYIADAELTIRDMTVPTEFRFSFAVDGDNAILEGKATLNRLNWQLGKDDYPDNGTISLQVNVSTTVVLKRHEQEKNQPK